MGSLPVPTGRSGLDGRDLQAGSGCRLLGSISMPHVCGLAIDELAALAKKNMSLRNRRARDASVTGRGGR
jgi:hypothetical protein